MNDPAGRLSPILILMLLALVASGTRSRAAGVAPPPYRADRVLVAFKQKAPLAARVGAVRRLGLRIEEGRQSPYVAALRIGPEARAAGASVKSVLAALRRDPAVRVAEPDYRVRVSTVPNDPRFSSLWGLQNTGQTGGIPDADIDAPEAWDVTTGSDSVVVAVIDTGVDYNHPDLRDNILRDASDQVVGYDFFNGDADPMDDNEHGTHVAGTIGARGNNGVGVTGVCHRVRLMPLKFLGADGTGDTSDAISCIDFAISHGARILSNSWGGGGFSQLLLEAIQRSEASGLLVVAAAGNEGANNEQVPSYPGNYNQVVGNVLSVAASTHHDALADFSNFGGQAVDLAAPGVGILSTTRGGTYRSFSGTSMATPHVSGAAALVLARFPGLTVDRLKQRLLGGVDRPSALVGQVATGRLNAALALETDTTPPAAPTSFQATHQGESSLRVTWSAPGDDGTAGRASRYDLRYSTRPITDESFPAASPCSGLPSPRPPGTPQSFVLDELEPGTAYYVALRAVDNVGNVSALAALGPVSTLPDTRQYLFRDDVEGTPHFSAQAPWAITTARSFSPSRSWTDSPNGQYANESDVTLTQAQSVTLTGTAPALAFRARIDLESGYDFLRVELSTDGGATWQTQGPGLTGTAEWRQYVFSLASYRDRAIRLRFRLVSDGTVTGDGVWLDDIHIYDSSRAVAVLEDDVEGSRSFTGQSPWAVTTEHSASPKHAYTDSPGAAYANNANTALVQNTTVSVGAAAPVLTFLARTDLELGYDFLLVEASMDDGATWARLQALTGTFPWSGHRVSLRAYFGQAIRLRYRLVSDNSVTGDGVWLDDVRITGEALQPLDGAAPPSPPADLSAVVVSSARIDLRWSDESIDEAGFEIERRAGDGPFQRIGTVPANTLRFSDTGAAVGTQYRYRVRAISQVGASPYSGEVSASIPEGGKLRVGKNLKLGARVLTGRSRTLTVRNAGTGTLVGQIGTLAPPFRIVSGGGAYNLGPGKSLPVVVEFVPAGRGTVRQTLRITSSDSARPAVDVTVTGRGS